MLAVQGWQNPVPALQPSLLHVAVSSMMLQARAMGNNKQAEAARIQRSNEIILVKINLLLMLSNLSFILLRLF